MADTSTRSRRDLIRAAAVGIAAAGTTTMLGPGVVQAQSDPVLEDEVNETSARTAVKSAATDDAAFLGQSMGGAAGLFGFSSAEASDPPPVSDAVGVMGVGVTGVTGIGEAGVYGGGTVSIWGDAFANETGVYGFSGDTEPPGSIPGVGVQAEAATNGLTALQVIGKARFTRSGRSNVSAGASRKLVNLAGVTGGSLVFAVLARSVANRYVRAVVPASGRFTVYLNGSVSRQTPFSWIVFDPSLAAAAATAASSGRGRRFKAMRQRTRSGRSRRST